MVESGGESEDAFTEVDTQAQEGPGRHVVGQVESSELARVLHQVDIPLVVYDEGGMIRLANRAAANLVGVGLDELVGTPVSQFVSPANLVEEDVADLVAGRFEGFTATRTVTPRGGDPIPVYAVAYAIDVDGQRLGVGVSVPRADLGRLGRHSVRLSSDLVPIAIGLARDDWTIESISLEVEELIGRRPADCVGLRLVDMINADDAAGLKDQFRRAPATPIVVPRVRFASSAGQWIQVSVLAAPVEHHAGRIRFALVGRIEETFPRTVDQDQEIELRLRRIGTHLRAAGMIDSVAADLADDDYRRMGELTSKQWEILSKLLRGERVPTIANSLFISQSTVRNHLSAIFERFGVHSQVELIERLRSEDQ